MPVTVTEDAVRALIRESLDSPAIEADPVVDPSASKVDPGDGYRPQSRTDLEVAITDLIKAIPDESVGTFYHKVKDIASDIVLPDDGSLTNKTPKDKEMSSEKDRVEETLRRAIRRELTEMYPQVADMGDDDADAELDEPANTNAKPTPEAKQKKGRWGDFLEKNLVPLDKIHGELGMPHSSIQRVFRVATEKSQFMRKLQQKDPKKFQSIMINALDDYINELGELGHLPGEDPEDKISKADIQLMRRHPEMVAELDSFRVYLDSYIKDAGFRAYGDSKTGDVAAPQNMGPED